MLGERDSPTCTILPGSPGAGFFDRVPRRVTGELFFFPPGLREAVFFSAKFQNFRVFPSLSKKLWIDGSLHREGRRSPGSGIPLPHRRAGFSRKRVSVSRPPTLLRKFPLAGERDSPAGVTGERDFRLGERNFPPPRSREAGFFPRQGQVQGVKGHSILHCTPWLAGILRSVDSICWQGADLEAVAFSCTGRRLARAANGFRFQGLGFRDLTRLTPK